MAEVLLFHHAQGLTDGVREFADTLTGAGHTVHLPDLYEGRVFADLDAGLAYAKEVGFGAIKERGLHAADGLADGLVYAGFSLGVMPAQELAQTRSGTKGALLFHACIPTEEFGGKWPTGVPVQVHGMDADPFFVDGGDLEAARALVASTTDADLFPYPGEGHLFADASLSDYDEPAATLQMDRVISFLAGIEIGESGSDVVHSRPCARSSAAADKDFASSLVRGDA
ncbi:MAG: dienelactone hydrolase family protein [Chloroflexota bacterium]